MAEKRKLYSYTSQKNKRRITLRLVFGFIIFFTLYNALTVFFFSVWAIENKTMQPDFNPGDRLIFTSRFAPLKRGNIVLVNKGMETQSMPLLVFDSVVRFFTAQRISLLEASRQYYIKRIIGLPGDEVSMTDHVFRIRPAGSPFSLTEFELVDRPYQPAIPQTPEFWDDSLPFSSSMDPLILGPHEFFVASDDRSNTNDSRTWGPVSSDLITARAILRFWPLTQISIP